VTRTVSAFARLALKGLSKASPPRRLRPASVGRPEDPAGASLRRPGCSAWPRRSTATGCWCGCCGASRPAGARQARTGAGGPLPPGHCQARPPSSPGPLRGPSRAPPAGRGCCAGEAAARRDDPPPGRGRRPCVRWRRRLRPLTCLPAPPQPLRFAAASIRTRAVRLAFAWPPPGGGPARPGRAAGAAGQGLSGPRRGGRRAWSGRGRLLLAPPAGGALAAVRPEFRPAGRSLPGLGRARRAPCSRRWRRPDRPPAAGPLDGLTAPGLVSAPGLAAALPAAAPVRRTLLRRRPARRGGSAPVASGAYVGEHWMASFAVYLLDT